MNLFCLYNCFAILIWRNLYSFVVPFIYFLSSSVDYYTVCLYLSITILLLYSLSYLENWTIAFSKNLHVLFFRLFNSKDLFSHSDRIKPKQEAPYPGTERFLSAVASLPHHLYRPHFSHYVSCQCADSSCPFAFHSTGKLASRIEWDEMIWGYHCFQNLLFVVPICIGTKTTSLCLVQVMKKI